MIIRSRISFTNSFSVNTYFQKTNLEVADQWLKPELAYQKTRSLNFANKTRYAGYLFLALCSGKTLGRTAMLISWWSSSPAESRANPPSSLEIELGTIIGRKVDLNTPGFLSKYYRDQILAEADVQYDAA